ncbi:MAG: hypothetical protein IJ836_04885 [Spirochaetales bacterium]|nr:hypothetical protein [Spirochaetales bacterium]
MQAKIQALNLESNYSKLKYSIGDEEENVTLASSVTIDVPASKTTRFYDEGAKFWEIDSQSSIPAGWNIEPK